MSEELLKLGQDWAAAELANDAAALKDLLVDDFVGIGPRGFTLTKAQWLERYETATLVNEKFSLHDVEVRVYGTAAVAVGIQTQESKYQGHPINDSFRISHVYVQVDGAWKLAGLQLSNLAQGAPPA